MNRVRLNSMIAPFTLLLAGLATSTLHAGQEAVVPLTYLIERSQFIAVVDVKEVTEVDVSAGRTHNSVFVAGANVEQHIKPDRKPIPRELTIAIVGSTRPGSSAVWNPIEKKRYLAFLMAEQGHYHYGLNMAFREIDAKGTVLWYECKDGRPTEFFRLPLKQAIQRIHAIQQELAANAN